MFSKILIANRGEVAVRIIRACKEMGIETVAVYSEADQNSLPVALADERICIGSNAAADSYLNQKNIISAALASNAEAIHPAMAFCPKILSLRHFVKKRASFSSVLTAMCFAPWVTRTIPASL